MKLVGYVLFFNPLSNFLKSKRYKSFFVLNGF